MEGGIQGANIGADKSTETNASNPPVAWIGATSSRISASSIRVYASLCSLLTIALIATETNASNPPVAWIRATSSRISASSIRVYASLCSLLTIALIALVSNLISDYDELTSGLMSFFLGLFALTWYYVHGAALSRTRRAFFDEANVLNTYQIYSRKYGYLYEPEPPTPGVAASSFNQLEVKTLGDAVRESANDPNDEKAKFNQAVQQHYGGMYENVLRVQNEMNLPEQSAAANLDAGFEGKLENASPDRALGEGVDRLLPPEAPGSVLDAQLEVNRDKQ
ncbi:hypothetical protein Tcan_17964 [Toxocara canis]|uniref:Transmembrane protein n=1 Tax=Toxocara canis TaxID=6265 RepID=A0A0B2VSS4_TOXCA|nr:hypothetical protein Tcan_17964 [Toxocara canis]